jgi:ADP-heptose:LPS heptosyltransferase
MEKWQARLPPRAALRVGLAWSGSPGNALDAIRSMSLAQLAPLFELAGIEFVVVQKDIRNHDAETLRQWPQIMNLAPDLDDFADTAAAISLLDVVIAVDTSVAHLVGALGKPVWIPLAFSPGWRWMLDRNDSPWYPTARLFRQPTIGDWDSVVRQLRHELQSLSERARTGNARM